MSMEKILSALRGHDDVVELAPTTGDPYPEISWGDHFFHYAPDGRIPTNRQPWATIVTKDYPDDTRCRLGAPDRWRLNIHVGSALFTEVLGYPPDRIDETAVDHSVTDVFHPHPLYGRYGWVCVVNPGPATVDRAVMLVGEAYRADRRRVERHRRRGGAGAAG